MTDRDRSDRDDRRSADVGPDDRSADAVPADRNPIDGDRSLDRDRSGPVEPAAEPDGGREGPAAGACPEGHLTYPPHPTCPDCGRRQDDRRVLTGPATVVTWTTAHAPPPGVRDPNTVAVVEFDVDGQAVRAIGQVVDGADVAVGDEVRPVYTEQLRDPEAGIREADSQDWDGYRFEPVD